MPNARIAGTGSYLPARTVTNDDLAKTMETSDEWIRERTGIERRHLAADDETTSTIGAAAARRAMEAAGVEASDIDLIIVGTTTPDKIFPSVACMIQREIGALGCGAFDLQAACSGFVYGMDVANRFIRTGGAETVLVIGAETLSRITDWSDRTTAVLFGDGAGAVVLQAAEERGIVAAHIHADGSQEGLLHVPFGVSAGYTELKSQSAFIHMNGNAVFRKAVATLDSIARETIEGHGVGADEIDWFIPHQANLRIITAAAKKLGMPMERVVVTVNEHANTSAASIPLALDIAVRDGRVQRGNLLLLEGFGAGFTWGSTLLYY